MINYRFESKFITRKQDKYKIFTKFFNNNIPLTKEFPDRVINNIYFDTPLFEFFKNNQAGISKRKKLRFRWYGKKNYNNIGTIEIKIRDNIVGTKIAHKNILIEDNIYLINIKKIESLIYKQIKKDSFLSILNSTSPVFFNTYKRSYFKIDSKIRVTIDSLIASKYLLNSRNLNQANNIIQPNITIVEIKSPLDCELKLRNYLGKLDLVRTRYSKYSSGIYNVNNLGHFS